MKTRINLPRTLLTLAGLLLMAACTIAPQKTVERRLEDMNSSKAAFSSQTLCEQIRLYAQVGLHYLDRDHMVVLVPTWMDDELDSEPASDIVQCIVDEGYRQLELLSQQPEKREEVSLAIHALTYKAYNINEENSLSFQDFLSEAVCQHDLVYPFELVSILYVGKYQQLPTYYVEENSLDRMVSELCG
jgi:hypothetical protein